MLPADSPLTPLPAPGLHPATTELRAYAAGTLVLAEQHYVEVHTLECERCAELLDAFLMTDVATTDRAVATLRARLHTRLGAPAPTPVAANNLWPRVAAAVALLGLVGGGFWASEHRTITTSSTATAAAPRPEVAHMATVLGATAVSALPLAAAAASILPATTDATRSKAPDYQLHRPAHAFRVVVAKPRHRPATHLAATVSAATATAAVALPNIRLGHDSATNVPKPFIAANAPTVVGATPEALPTARGGMPTNQKAGFDTVSAAPGVAAAVSPKTLAAGTVHVANSPMPAALAINPAPVGGRGSLHDYLRRGAMEFEPESGQSSLTGTVRVRFMVGADGKLSNLKVLRGLRNDYDAEALRLVCDGPGWHPGVAGGRRASLPMEVNVSF